MQDMLFMITGGGADTFYVEGERAVGLLCNNFIRGKQIFLQ